LFAPADLRALSILHLQEPWGPHGTVLSEIARCTVSPDERVQVLSVLWRRVAEDRPDQWRCVYKALAVLEYLVANGSDAVVEELCNSARRLTGLSSFQYKDNEGKDQVRLELSRRRAPGAAVLCGAETLSRRGALTGARVRSPEQGINVRHKSATILEVRAHPRAPRAAAGLGLNLSAASVPIQLLGDKEKIRQVRAKALANRNKYSGVSADEMRQAQGIVRPGKFCLCFIARHAANCPCSTQQ